ncbi:hypothetical protein PENTCL1PPCAC_15352, partial [Pristionchus entomophagus]
MHLYIRDPDVISCFYEDSESVGAWEKRMVMLGGGGLECNLKSTLPLPVFNCANVHVDRFLQSEISRLRHSIEPTHADFRRNSRSSTITPLKHRKRTNPRSETVDHPSWNANRLVVEHKRNRCSLQWSYHFADEFLHSFILLHSEALRRRRWEGNAAPEGIVLLEHLRVQRKVGILEGQSKNFIGWQGDTLCSCIFQWRGRVSQSRRQLDDGTPWRRSTWMDGRSSRECDTRVQVGVCWMA